MFNFSHYKKQLQQLDEKQGSLLNQDKLLLLLSGSSQLETAALSAVQKDLLQELSLAGYSPVFSNFPYHQQFKHDKSKSISLLKASWSNIHYFGHTVFDKEFQNMVCRLLKPVLQYRDCVIITQSQGLNLLSLLLQQEELIYPLKVFALGPVAYSLPALPLLDLHVIKSRKDYYSRFLDRHQVETWTAGSHFDYPSNPDIRRIIYEQIKKN
ncbi:hypothetical protein A0O21_01640 [Streptococcus pantholopis]|uniref:Alpha/beta hydrolase n=2 Tax=Streptococcus pantholopis TaxID=1811193 RepID=A0A172Q5R5_9STRE|nr:hypothetical protein A0O21_01640 [Streptococcus pantholopis]